MYKVFLICLTTLSVLGCTSTTKNTPLPVKQENTTVINQATGGNRNPEPITPDLYPDGVKATPEPIIRYGRYNLTTAAPSAEQQDLMAQIITTNIPGNINSPMVKDAMSYVMERSGYSLCPTNSSKEVRILYTRPLPAAHYKLGPITLRNALQILAGPAYQVNIDEVNRSVCFVVRTDYQLSTTAISKRAPKKPVATEHNNQMNATKGVDTK